VEEALSPGTPCTAYLEAAFVSTHKQVPGMPSWWSASGICLQRRYAHHHDSRLTSVPMARRRSTVSRFPWRLHPLPGMTDLAALGRWFLLRGDGGGRCSEFSGVSISQSISRSATRVLGRDDWADWADVCRSCILAKGGRPKRAQAWRGSSGAEWRRHAGIEALTAQSGLAASRPA